MTLRKAERTTGLEIVLAKYTDGLWYAVGWLGNVLPAHAISKGAKTRSGALKSLVDENLRVNREIVMRQQKYRCARTGKIVPLQAHHTTHRGLGGGTRDDRVEILLALSAEAHRKEHS